MRFALALAALLWAGSAEAQGVQSQLEALGLSVYTYEQMSVTATATLLSYKRSDENVVMVSVRPIDGDIIVTRNGQAPTASYGLRVYQFGVVLLSRAEALLFQAIRKGTTNVTCEVEYYAPNGTPGIP